MKNLCGETKIGRLKIFFSGIFRDGYSEQLQIETALKSCPFVKQIIAGSVRSKVVVMGVSALSSSALSGTKKAHVHRTFGAERH